MTENSIKRHPVIKVNYDDVKDTSDALAIEEPLEIRLEYGSADERAVKNISVTMRTPGDDKELASGFLFTEGIIKSSADISKVDHCFIACAENKQNTILVSLKEGVMPFLQNTERNFYTTSSCGVCGKGSISSIKTVSSFLNKRVDRPLVETEILYGLSEVLRYHQAVFADTGGLHASAFFNTKGELLFVKEDVGRHNALDKLIGAAMEKDWLPLDNGILLLSGRASFELIQKAAMAGISVVAAVGAPSSLAVELADEFNITLVGFLRNRRFNIYTAAHRIVLPVNETTHQK